MMPLTHTDSPGDPPYTDIGLGELSYRDRIDVAECVFAHSGQCGYRSQRWLRWTQRDGPTLIDNTSEQTGDQNGGLDTINRSGPVLDRT